MQYTVGKLWFFPELGDKPTPGSVIELPEEVAAKYMHNEPGLLAPVRVKAVGDPQKEVRGPVTQQETSERKPKRANRKQK